MEYLDYLKNQNNVLGSIDQTALERIVTSLIQLRASGGVVWVSGNGGSAATASHAVADLVKTSQSDGKGGIRCIAISELVSLQTAVSNDISFESSHSFVIEHMANPGDILLAISVSGTSPNIVAAQRAATAKGMHTVALFGNAGASEAAHYNEAVVLDSADYQIVENCHLALIHWFVKSILAA